METFTKTKKDQKVVQKRIMPGSGVWIERPRKSAILVCPICGGKYIKTRPGQNACVRCMMDKRDQK